MSILDYKGCDYEQEPKPKTKVTKELNHEIKSDSTPGGSHQGVRKISGKRRADVLRLRKNPAHKAR